MKSLEFLTNVERAKLMFELLPNEIPDLLQTMDRVVDTVLQQTAYLHNTWSNPLLSASQWIRLADSVREELSHNHHKYKTAKRFSESLFDGYLAFFSRHCVDIHAQDCESPRFKALAALLFGSELD